MDSANANAVSNSSNASKGTNVQVAVRCRPMNAEERRANHAMVVTCDTENKCVRVAYGPAGKKIMKSFAFDRVFGMYSRQEEVFEAVVRPIVDETLAGFNCTIFAYGQTGTGKTHTMEGDIHSADEAGIVPRAVKAILEQLEASGVEFTIRVSFLELYNEELQDLLNSSGEKRLKLCEDVKKGVVCQNLEEIAVLNADDIFDILQRGIMQRQTAATLCNKNSSRSHTIFTLKIMIKEYNVEGEEVVRHGQLNLVDLAGSECIGRSGAKNDRAREAGSINQSLLTLGRVITALVDHHVHVPYRDSKLTRLLQESLGGKAKTCIIATLSPSQAAVEETMSTLDYAYRARNIKNQPTVNQKLTKKVIMKEYFAEIETLRTQLLMTREKNGVYLDPNEFYAMETRLATQEAQLKECEAALSLRVEESKILKADNEDLNNRIAQVAEQLDTVTLCLEETREELAVCKKELGHVYVELQASNSVVQEQLATERALEEQRSILIDTVRAREMDIQVLLLKLGALEEQEQIRIQETESFVARLRAQHQQLVSHVHKLMAASEIRSGEIQCQVRALLDQSGSSSKRLELVFAAASAAFNSAATRACKDLVAGCESFGADAGNRGDQLIGSIDASKEALQNWIQEASGRLRTCDETISRQRSQVLDINSKVQEHSDHVEKEYERHLAEQRKHSDALTLHMNQLCASFNENSQRYILEAQRSTVDANVQLEQRAKALEQTVLNMTQNFLAASRDALIRSQQSTEDFLLGMQTSWTAGLKRLDENQESMLKSSQVHIAALSDHNCSTASTLQLGLTDLENEISGQSATIASLHRALDEESTYCSRSAKDLRDQTTAWKASILDQGASTTGRARAMVREVEQSSQEMADESKKVLDAFIAAMDSDCSKTSSLINEYHKVVGVAVAEQESGLQQSSQESASYGEEVGSTLLARSGTTPRKLNAMIPVDKPATRMHDEIRHEARLRLALEKLSYEQIAQRIAIYANTCPAQSTPRSSFPDERIASASRDEDDAQSVQSSSNRSEAPDVENMPPSANSDALAEYSAPAKTRRGKLAAGSVTTRGRHASLAAKSFDCNV